MTDISVVAVGPSRRPRASPAHVTFQKYCHWSRLAPRRLILCYHQGACGGVRLALLRRLVGKAALTGLASRCAPLALKAPPRTRTALPGLRCVRVSGGSSLVRQPSHAVHGCVLCAVCTFAAGGTLNYTSRPYGHKLRNPSDPRIRALQRFKQAARRGFHRRRRTQIGSPDHYTYYADSKR